jgi:hypothetical protein
LVRAGGLEPPQALLLYGFRYRLGQFSDHRGQFSHHRPCPFSGYTRDQQLEEITTGARPEPPRSEILLEEIRDALAKKGAPPAASPARTERLLEEIRDALAKN